MLFIDRGINIYNVLFRVERCSLNVEYFGWWIHYGELSVGLFIVFHNHNSIILTLMEISLNVSSLKSKKHEGNSKH